MLLHMILTVEDAHLSENHKKDIEKAFEQYYSMVYKLAFVRTGNKSDAEDILSDVFVRLIKNIEKIQNDIHLKAWLIRTTINCSNSALKRAGRLHQVRLTEVDAVIKEDNHSVLPAVLSLPINQKTVIYMFYFEGYSVEEIAKICGVKKGTVKSRLARARESLKNTLEGEDIDV